MDLNNRRTGKDATKPPALGLLGHSVKACIDCSKDKTLTNWAKLPYNLKNQPSAELLVWMQLINSAN